MMKKKEDLLSWKVAHHVYGNNNPANMSRMNDLSKLRQKYTTSFRAREVERASKVSNQYPRLLTKNDQRGPETKFKTPEEIKSLNHTQGYKL